MDQPTIEEHGQRHIRAFFAAKAIQYESIAGFQIREAGRLTCLHGVPGWPEVDAFYAFNLEPAESVATMVVAEADARHALTVFDTDPAPDFTEYRALGYTRTGARPQPFMRLPLGVTPTNRDVDVRTVEDTSDIELLNAGGRRVVDPGHMGEPRIRYAYIRVDGKPVTWGASVDCAPDIIYVFGVETDPEYRRRGLGRSLMAHLQNDALARGFSEAILCASPDGYQLYSAMQYQMVAYMHMLVRERANSPKEVSKSAV